MNKIFFIGVGIVAIIVVGLLVLLFSSEQEGVDEDTSQAVVQVFQDELVEQGVKRIGQPIEGFDPFSLMAAFPGLQERDFNGVLSFEGVYRYENSELKYERTADQPVTSAEQTVSSEGYSILLGNILSRLDMEVATKDDARAVVEELKKPTEATELSADVQAHIDSKRSSVVLEDPMPLSTISSPLTIRGEASAWYFEASFPVTLVDWDGRIIAQSYVTAQGDWMTTDFVPFEGEIEFEIDEDVYVKRGTLILHKANASGLPEHDDALEIPIFFE